MATHRRYQEVATRISRYVAEHGLTAGSRLPGEIDLAKACGVSRPTIREAMVALEIAGEQQRGMVGVGSILGVQAEIAHDIIHPAIFVKIRRGD